MTKVFVDTNVIIDLLADRPPFSRFAIEIFDQEEKGNVQLFTSSHTIATAHYLLKKYINESELREILFEVMQIVQVQGIDSEILLKGLKSKHKDFEDALQIFSAGTVQNLSCIVTRNIKDFKSADCLVLAPDEFVKTLKI